MGLLNRQKNYKKCPYCKSKNPLASRYCGACHLDFYQLDKCTNAEAKKMLRHRRFGETFEGEIVNTSTLPSDVSRAKLIIYTLLFGLFGVHNFYVGRYFKAWVQCVLGVIFTGLAIAISYFLDVPTIAMTFLGIQTNLVNVLFLFGLLVGIYPATSWLFDLFAVVIKKYEVPIALKIPVDIPDEEEI